MNVPFADYLGLHYTVSRLMGKKVSVARLKTRPQYRQELRQMQTQVALLVARSWTWYPS